MTSDEFKKQFGNRKPTMLDPLNIPEDDPYYLPEQLECVDAVYQFGDNGPEPIQPGTVLTFRYVDGRVEHAILTSTYDFKLLRKRPISYRFRRRPSPRLMRK